MSIKKVPIALSGVPLQPLKKELVSKMLLELMNVPRSLMKPDGTLENGRVRSQLMNCITTAMYNIIPFLSMDDDNPRRVN